MVDYAWAAAVKVDENAGISQELFWHLYSVVDMHNARDCFLFLSTEWVVPLELFLFSRYGEAAYCFPNAVRGDLWNGE